MLTRKPLQALDRRAHILTLAVGSVEIADYLQPAPSLRPLRLATTNPPRQLMRPRLVAARTASTRSVGRSVDRRTRGDGGRIARLGGRGMAAAGVRVVLGAVALFAVAAGVLDVVGISHQVGEGRAGLALLAGIIAATRVAVGSA